MNWTPQHLAEHMARMKAYREPDCDDDIPDPGLENELQGKVIRYCNEHGWPIFHDRSRKKNEPGWPDNFIFLPDRKVCLIELKSETGTLREEQIQLRQVLNWLGHPVHVARSFKRVVEIINEVLEVVNDS